MTTTASHPRVLMVDDDDDIRYAIARILTRCGCDVTESDSYNRSIELLKDSHFDIIFSDVRFQNGPGGEEILKYCTENLPQTRVVLISCAMDHKAKKYFLNLGAVDCLEKPFFKEACMAVLEKIDQQNQRAA